MIRGLPTGFHSTPAGGGVLMSELFARKIAFGSIVFAGLLTPAALGTDLKVPDILSAHVVGYTLSNQAGNNPPQVSTRSSSVVGDPFLRNGISANSTRVEVSSWIHNTSKTTNRIMETEQYANPSKSSLVSAPVPIELFSELDSVIEWTVPALLPYESIDWDSS